MTANKPQSMLLKDWLISLTASKLSMEEELCSTIVNWAYQKAKEATLNNSIIELSGFGKIYAGPKKVERKLQTARDRIVMLNGEILAPYSSEERKEEYRKKILETKEYIKYLESKNQ